MLYAMHACLHASEVMDGTTGKKGFNPLSWIEQEKIVISDAAQRAHHEPEAARRRRETARAATLAASRHVADPTPAVVRHRPHRRGRPPGRSHDGGELVRLHERVGRGAEHVVNAGAPGGGQLSSGLAQLRKRRGKTDEVFCAVVARSGNDHWGIGGRLAGVLAVVRDVVLDWMGLADLGLPLGVAALV